MTNIKILFFAVMLSLNHIVEAKVVDFSKDIKLQKYLRVHQCRQSCLLKTLEGDNSVNFNTCRGVPDCFMCYDYCEVLPKAAVDLAHSMCSDQVYCSKGCRIACSYHRILGPHTLVYEIDHQ